MLATDSLQLSVSVVFLFRDVPEIPPLFGEFLAVFVYWMFHFFV